MAEKPYCQGISHTPLSQSKLLIPPRTREPYDFLYDFDQDYQGANGVLLKYTAEVIVPTFFISQIGLDSTVTQGGPVEEVTKLVEFDGGSVLLKSTEGSGDFELLPNLKKITITDTYNPNGGSIENSLNSIIAILV
jgi:hypothetical protein